MSASFPSASPPLSPSPPVSPGTSSSTVDRLQTLLPPPEQSYPSLHDAESAIHELTTRAGFEVSKRKAVKNVRGDVYKYLLACTQGGRLDNKRKLTPATRVVTRRSLKKGCPMAIWLVAGDSTDPAGSWCVRHRQNGRSEQHNHGPLDASSFAGHRRRARAAELNANIPLDADRGITGPRLPVGSQAKHTNVRT